MIKADAVTPDSEHHINSLEHGGNIHRAARELGMEVDKIKDFSASINPLGISSSVRDVITGEIETLVNYPDTDTWKLRSVIAGHHDIDPGTIICGNGSTELIYLIPRAIKPDKVLIPAPTFSEYERACGLNKESRVMSYELKEENNFRLDPDEFIKAMSGNMLSKKSTLHTLNSKLCYDMAFLCNPNNPTGHLLKRADVLRIAEAAQQMKCYLVIDEAFIDFARKESVIHDVKNNPYLIVLRSMTKFYALTGLRIGYSVFHESVIKKIIAYKEPWTVNSLAQKAAVTALMDTRYAEQTRMIIAEEKRYLEGELGDMGIEYLPSEVNFYMLRIERAKKIIEQLYKKGILIRNCDNFRGLDGSFIRIAVKTRRVNEILIGEMRKICAG